MISANDAQREKKTVALSSVGAAVGLTSLKIIVALLTGSLGILAEAAHSGLNLVTALMTFFAVRVSGRPADETHHSGHGKIENLSAFLEAGLLLLTALWIFYQALRHIIYPEEGHVDASIWAFLVMVIAVTVDYICTRALQRVARKLGSQALEADALHFNTDIWSSLVVIVGLFLVRLSQSFSLPSWAGLADSFAALGVTGIVIWISLQLTKETIDALLDRAPEEFATQIRNAIREVEGITEVRRVRVRRAGNKLFADIVISAPRIYTLVQTHELSERVEKAAVDGVHTRSPQAEVDVLVHVEPTASPSETVIDQIHYLAEQQGIHVHDIHVREVGGKLEADFDVEVQSDMNFDEAHNVATRLEQTILQNNDMLRRVTTHLETTNTEVVSRKDVTQQYPDMAAQIIRIAYEIAGAGSAHDVHLYRSYLKHKNHLNRSDGEQNAELDLVLHTNFDPHIPLTQAHVQAEEIQRALLSAYPDLSSVVIQTEPLE